MSRLTSQEILDSIQQRGLVPDDIVAKLRDRVRERPHETGPEALTAWLVKHNQLTQFQADELLRGGATVKRGLPPEKASLAEIIDESEAAGMMGGPAFGSAGLGAFNALPGWGAASMPGLGQPGPFGAGPQGNNRPQARQAPKPTWDSKLMLLGGGGLILLLLAGGILYWLIGRGSGDEAFKLAEDDYNAGNYTQAIEKYNRFLETFSSHPKASLARVHRGLAKMRQLTTRPADWTQALAEVDAVLQEIRREREFPEARPELASILPRLVEGLIAQAQKQQDAQVLAQAEQAFNLLQNSNYVPQALRNEEALRRLEAERAQVQRDLDRDRELNKAIEEIAAAAARNETAMAYAIRRDLVRTFPDLANNARLREAIAQVAVAEQQAVQYVAEPVPALNEEPETAVAAVTSLASTSGRPLPAGAGKRVFALASGAAYGLDASTGELLWRRFVGFDATALPQPIGPNGDDVLLVDAVRSELVRVEAATGKLRWRLPLEGGQPLSPVVAGDAAWVATREGRLYHVNLESGEARGYFLFPQPLSTPPAVHPSGTVVYQVGQQGSLYVLQMGEEPACKAAVYLGHEPDSVIAAPLTIEDVYLLAAVNTGARYSQLHVFRLGDDGRLSAHLQADALDGQVQISPQREGNSVVVATDSGALYMYAVGDVDSEQPLTLIARQGGSSRLPVAPQVRLTTEHLWVADRVLQYYAFQEATGSFAPVWQRYRGGICTQPLQAVGDALIYARRVPGKPGVAVAAVGATSGEPYWETVLAAPSATGPLVDPETQSVAAVTTGGALYELPLAQLERGHAAVSKPIQQVTVDSPLSTAFPVSRFADGHWVLAVDDTASQLLVASPGSQGRRLDWKPLPDVAAFPPVKQHERLLVPGVLGQVFCLTPGTWRADAQPFQPVIENGRRYAWQATLPSPSARPRTPVPPVPMQMANAVSRPKLSTVALALSTEAMHADSDEVAPSVPPEEFMAQAEGSPADDASPFLLAEADGSLYLLALIQEPVPHLAQLAESRLEHPLATPLVALGDTAFAVDQAHRLIAISYNDLRPRVLAELTGPAIWGPRLVNDAVLLVTEDDTLCCYNADGSLRWQRTLVDGPLAGDPVPVDGDLIVAAVDGTLRRIDAASGQERGSIQVGEPLTCGAVAVGDQLLLTSADGSLLVARMP